MRLNNKSLHFNLNYEKQSLKFFIFKRSECRHNSSIISSRVALIFSTRSCENLARKYARGHFSNTWGVIPKEIIEDASPRARVQIQIGPLHLVTGGAPERAHDVAALTHIRARVQRGGVQMRRLRNVEIAVPPVPQVLFVIIKPTAPALYLY